MSKVTKPSDIFQINVNEYILEYGCMMIFSSVSNVRSFLTSNIVNGNYVNICLDGTFIEMEDKTYVKNTNNDDSFHFVDTNTITSKGLKIQIRKDSNTGKVVVKIAVNKKKLSERYFEWLETCHERMYIFSGKLFSLGSDLKI